MHNKASLALAFGVMGVSAWAVISALNWPWKAALFPLVIGIPLFCLAVAEVVWVFVGDKPATRSAGEPLASETSTPRGILAAVAWILGLFALVVLLGFQLAVAIFVFIYVKWQGREKWIWTIVYTLAVAVIFYGLFDQLLHLPFPDGWIQSWLKSG